MSRGMTLGELMTHDHKEWAPPTFVKPVPVQNFPNQYVLFLQKQRLYYAAKRDYPWTNDVQAADLCIDKSVPDSIVVAWNKESKDKYKDSAIISGIGMKDNVSVVDVTKILKLYVIKIGDIYYYTGNDWTTKISEASAYRDKKKVEAILLASKMSRYSEMIEIDLDRASFL